MGYESIWNKIESAEENSSKNLPHGFLKGYVSSQGRGNKKSGLGTHPLKPATCFEVGALRQLLFSFPVIRWMEVIACLDSHWHWAPLNGVCIPLHSQAVSFEMAGTLFCSAVLWLWTPSKRSCFPWLGLVQRTSEMPQKIAINGHKRMYSKHIQDKSFHLKHRKNFKNPASHLDKKIPFQFRFINPHLCPVDAMPTCSVVRLITVICSTWCNVLCYDNVKRAPIGLRTQKVKSYTWLQVEYLSTYFPLQKQGL